MQLCISLIIHINKIKILHLLKISVCIRAYVTEAVVSQIGVMSCKS